MTVFIIQQRSRSRTNTYLVPGSLFPNDKKPKREERSWAAIRVLLSLTHFDRAFTESGTTEVEPPGSCSQVELRNEKGERETIAALLEQLPT